MKLLLTSAGVKNESIRNALVGLLGKPLEESSALLIPTAIYPFSVGPEMAGRLIRGEVATPLAELGWKSVGVLELTALASVDEEVWVPTVRASDALLFWGGDPFYLSFWMRESGLTDLLRTLENTVYVGVSAGAMASASLFGEIYSEPRSASGRALTATAVLFETRGREVPKTVGTAAGAGLVDFAVIPHYENEDHYAGKHVNVERWAAALPVPVYAIDDQTAISVVDGVVEVVSEGNWRRFEPQ